MKIAIVCFSGTGNTAKIGEVIKEKLIGLGSEVDEYDITSYESRTRKIDFDTYQAIVFGMPIHSCRAPRVVREWMTTLNGKGRKCGMFFTYGGFGVHPSHYSTRDILRTQNFNVVSSAEFLGAHTYNIGDGWRAMIGRPDNSDFELAAEFAQKTYERFTGADTGILGDLEKSDMTEEFLDMIEGFRFKVVSELPNRNGEECSMCMTCEDLCPTQAITAESGVADQSKCICCMGCVDNCPDGILKTNDFSASWQNKLEMHKTNEEEMNNLKSKIYL